jgi:hypothetical protein
MGHMEYTEYLDPYRRGLRSLPKTEGNCGQWVEVESQWLSWQEIGVTHELRLQTPLHTPVSHQTSLTSYRSKDRNLRLSKTAATEDKLHAQNSPLALGPYAAAVHTAMTWALGTGVTWDPANMHTLIQ